MVKSELYPKMLYILGAAHFSMKNYAEADKQFQAYLSKFPTGEFVQDAEYRTALCSFYADSDSGYQKALELFNSYLKKYPDDTLSGELLAMKADSLMALKHPAEAADAYRDSALTSTSRDVVMYSIMAAAKQYQALGKWEAMDSMFRKFLEKYPNDPTAVPVYYYIAQAMIKQGKSQEAKAFLVDKIRDNISDPRKEAVERLLIQMVQLCAKGAKTPAGPSALTASSSKAKSTRAAERTPAPKDPAADLDEILATFPDTPSAKARKLFAQAELKSLLRKPDEGVKYLNQIADSTQAEDLSPLLLGKVGDRLLARGQEASASKMYDKIISNYGKGEYADYGSVGRGNIAMSQGKFEAALKDYTIAADELDMSKLKDATLGKAKALFALKNYSDAAAIFKMIGGLKEWRGEATAESLYYLGRIAQENKDFPKALTYYQRVALTHQKYPRLVAKAYMDSAQCFKELGKSKEEKNTYAEMLANEKLIAAKVPELGEAQKQLDQLP